MGLRLVICVAVSSFLLMINPSHASDAMKCVQSFLQFKAHNPGPADGVIGAGTRRAATAYLATSSVGLPKLDEANAAQWCAHAEADQGFKAMRDFTYNGYGIIPSEVVFKALAQPEGPRKKSCIADFWKLPNLEKIKPITGIVGFNSRMDNRRDVKFATEAEAFTGEFTALAMGAFVQGDDEAKTRLIKLLEKWARAGAFLKTRACVTRSGSIITTGQCSEWRRRDGKDLSGMKDATHSTFLMAALVRAYLALLSDHEPNTLASSHKAIRKWVLNGFARRLKRPSSVYFGLNMGWYWPSINLAMAQGKTKQARQMLTRLQRGLNAHMNSDGSIKDRTTRGDRALWYHFTSIGEVMASLEMMRAANIKVSPGIEAKLHKAVDLFIRAVDDFKVIHPWAKKRRNSSYKGQTQDWNRNWHNGDFAGSWLHSYPYRYPNHPNSEKLKIKVFWRDKTATKDIDYGIGVGCLYNLAAGRVL